MNFEKREVTRAADVTEQADLVKRLLEVLSSIDQTKEEAKSAASEYNGIMKDLHKREIGLRFNLQTGTVTQEIEVHAIANEATGMMEYFNREGIEVTELRHPISEKQKEQEALQRQLDMFQESSDEHKITNVTINTNNDQSVTLGEELALDEQPVNGDISKNIPSGIPLGDVADLVSILSVKSPSAEQPINEEIRTELFGTTPQPRPEGADELPFEFTDEKPDMRDGINGAIAILTGNENPLPKNGKKRKPEPEAV